MPTDQTEQVDHKAEALEILRAAEEDGARGQSMAVGIALAQAHASLAIAEGQERLAEEIKAFRELMGRSAT